MALPALDVSTADPALQRETELREKATEMTVGNSQGHPQYKGDLEGLNILL